MVINPVGSHDAPHRMGILAIVISGHLPEALDIPVSVVSVRHIVSPARFMCIQESAMEEQPVLRIGHIKASLFIAHTGQNRPDSAIGPGAVHRMEL